MNWSDHGGDLTTRRECLVVDEKGEYYHETGVQRRSGDALEIRASKGELDARALKQLREALSPRQLEVIPRFQRPSFPLSSSEFHLVTVWTPSRMLGYYEQATSEPPASKDVNARTEKTSEWQRSKLALVPLETWVHDVERSPAAIRTDAVAGRCDKK